MRYFLYLTLYLPLQLLTYLITPALPLFAVARLGWSNNHAFETIGPRLPLWLSWFDTPDNSLLGDQGWWESHPPTYWAKVGWLYRNSLYGFKWTVLAAPMAGELITRTGPIKVNYHTGEFGTQRYRMGRHWQYKSVRPIMGRVLILNFGWLLDDASQHQALFMFSPRLKSRPQTI